MPTLTEETPLKTIRSLPLVACLVLAAGCGSDDEPIATHTLTPGTAHHGSMTPAAPVEAEDGAGPLAISAIADAGFVFAGWVATPADGADFGDAALASTGVILSSDATIAPTFMVATADYFVNQRLGSDEATGTSAAQPFRSITHAAAVAGAAKAVGSVVAVAPGHYDTANGEVFPIVVPPYVTLVGDEENRGAGITVQGSGPMPSWPALPVGVIPSTGASLRGLHFLASGQYTLAYDIPSGGAGIILRRNTIEAGSSGGLYIQVAEAGAIQDNVWAAGEMTLVAVGGTGNTVVSGNVFNGPIELDDNYLDLGDGAGSSPGQNQFIGNGMCYFEGVGLMARNNHWRHAPPTVSPDFSHGASDYDMHLASPGTTIDTTGYW